MIAEISAEGWVLIITGTGAAIAALLGQVLNLWLSYRRETARLKREEELAQLTLRSKRELVQKIDMNTDVTVTAAACIAEKVDKTGETRAAIEGLQQAVSDSRQPPR